MVRGGEGGRVSVSSSPIRLEQKGGRRVNSLSLSDLEHPSPSALRCSWFSGVRTQAGTTGSPGSQLSGLDSITSPAILGLQLTDSRSWTPQPPLSHEPIPPNKSLYTHTHTHSWFCFSGKPWLIQKARNNQDLLEEGQFKYRGKDRRCMWLRFGGL